VQLVAYQDVVYDTLHSEYQFEAQHCLVSFPSRAPPLLPPREGSIGQKVVSKWWRMP